MNERKKITKAVSEIKVKGVREVYEDTFTLSAKEESFFNTGQNRRLGFISDYS